MTTINKIKIGSTTYDIGKEATSTESGWLSYTDKNKLDSITHGAEPTKIPTGGAAGQVLIKNSSASYDLAWSTISTSSGTGTSSVTVDTSLSTSSTNPVQNAVITTELNKKIDEPTTTGTQGQVLAIGANNTRVWQTVSSGSSSTYEEYTTSEIESLWNTTT